MMHVDVTIYNTLVMITYVLEKTIFFEENIISKISIDHNSIIQAIFNSFV